MTIEWITEHWLAVTLLSVYTGVLLYNAHVGRQRAGGLAGYYVGDRRMGGVVIGLSFFATFASTNSYIGHAGKGYDFGIPWLVMAASLVVFTYLSWRFVGPQLRRFAAEFDALTLPDYLGSRFAGATDREGHPIRWWSGLVVVFASLLYLVAIFKGAGHLFEQFLGISYTAAVGLTLAVVVLYTSIGGFVSVVRTDALQGVLMVLGAITIFYFVTDAAGGVASITTLKARPETEHLFTWNAGIPFAVLLGISLSGALKLLVDPRQLSRFYALKSDRDARVGIWVALVGLLVVQGCLFPVGVYAHLIMEGVTDTDLIVPTLVSDLSVFPLWAGDFLIVAILAAAMSSMDSVLLVAASTLHKNMVAPFRKSTDNGVRWTRVSVVLFAVVSAGLALNPPGDIVEITIFSGSLYAVCFLPAVLLGLHWRRGDVTCVLASMAVGVLMLIVWLLAGFNAYLHEVFPGLLASVAVYVGLASTRPAVIPLSPGRSAPESLDEY